MSVSVQKQTNLPGHKWQVSCLEFSSDGLYLASGGWDKMVILWDLRTLEPSQQIVHHRQPVTCLSFQPRVSRLGLLATGSADQTVAIWNPVSGALMKSFQHHSNWVLSTSFSPNGRLLASASWDKTICICDVETGQALTSLTGHTTGVWTCSFNPEDSRGNDTLCSGAEDGSLKLWDLRSKSVVMSLVGGHEDRIKSCTWSPSAQYVASSSADGRLALWEPRSGTALTRIKAYDDSANSVKFYPLIRGTDNSVPLLFSVGGRTCNVWHPFRQHNKQLLSVKLNASGQEIQALGISPDGSLLATGGSDKAVSLSTVDISLDQIDALPIETADRTNRGTLLWKKYTRKVIEHAFNDRQPTTASDQSRNSALLVGMAVHRSENVEKHHVERAKTPQYASEKLQAEPEVMLQNQRQKLRPRSEADLSTFHDFEHKTTQVAPQNPLQNARQQLRKVRKLSNGSTVSSSSGQENNGQEYAVFSKVNGWNGVVNGRQQNGYTSPVHQPGMLDVDDQTVIVSIESESEDINDGYQHINDNHDYVRRVNIQPSSRYQPFNISNDSHGHQDDFESTSVSSSSYYADIDEVAQEMLDLTRQIENHRL